MNLRNIARVTYVAIVTHIRFELYSRDTAKVFPDICNGRTVISATLRPFEGMQLIAPYLP